MFCLSGSQIQADKARPVWKVSAGHWVKYYKVVKRQPETRFAQGVITMRSLLRSAAAFVIRRDCLTKYGEAEAHLDVSCLRMKLRHC